MLREFLTMRLDALLLSATLALLGSSAPVAANPSPAPVVTIVDGEAQVIRESSRFTAVEGLRLEAEDIVHTADGTRVVRIEFSDGSAVDLGPATRLQLQPRLAAESGTDRPSRLYALSGWFKLTGSGLGLASPRLDATDVSGSVVLRIADDAVLAFVESGGLRLVERAATRPPLTHALKDGEAYVRQGDDAGTLTPRPGAAMLKAMPRAFTDSLPMRASRFQDRLVAPPAPTEIAYVDVAPWIHGERALRYGFVQRWRGKAREPQFRSALLAELAMHPEWDRTLFPEKYAPPKPRPVARATTTPAAAPQVATTLRAPLFAPELLPLTSAATPDRSPRVPSLPRLP
ncbi:hypothetical protein [uncultured Methylibium sp.]|uniref:hypothetical protein n=1 Tax=uncultured Methylibium sp. TaxID=381093 RepID=UPI0025E1F0B3|nr:hypothetical protein [uncultured Methylibium sp.]